MKYIDQSGWPRKAHYDFFSPMSHPFYSLTFPLDVTALRRYTKARGLSFYHSLVYLSTAAMNQVPAFRYKIRGEDVVLHESLIPSFTFLKPGSELFQIATLPSGSDLTDFCSRARALCACQSEFITDGPWDTDQLIYYTCLPWFPITALTNERNVDGDDSVPRVSWGRYEERDGKTTLSLSLELNHRLLDGVHVGQYYECLCRLIQDLPDPLS